MKGRTRIKPDMSAARKVRFSESGTVGKQNRTASTETLQGPGNEARSGSPLRGDVAFIARQELQRHSADVLLEPFCHCKLLIEDSTADGGRLLISDVLGGGN